MPPRPLPSKKAPYLSARPPVSAPSGAVSLGLAAIVLAIVTAGSHWPVLQAQATCFDDGEYVTQNRLVQRPSWYSTKRFLTEVLRPSTVKGYYQPFTMISIMFDFATGGCVDDFRAFHRTNLILHVSNTLLLFITFYRLFGLIGPCVIVAAVFGTHPLAVEPLAWLGERKTMLATFFSLACVLAYLQSIRGTRRTWLTIAWLFYLSAMLSKPTAVPIAVLLVVLDWWPLGRFGRRALLEKAPFLALALLFSVVSLVSQGRTAGIDTTSSHSAANLPVVILYLVSFYVSKMVWPRNLCSAYALPEPLHWTHPSVLLGVCGTLGLIAVVAFSLRRTRAIAAGFLFFLIAAFPTLGLVKYSWMPAADKYVYLPAVGLLLTLSAALTALWRHGASVAKWPRYAIVVVAVLVVAGEAHATRAYLAKWQDTETLYSHILTHSPNTPAALNNLGNLLADRGRSDEAIHYFREALRVFPEYVQAHFNLGTALARKNLWDEALHHFKVALELAPNDSDLHYQLANSLQGLGRNAEAVEHFLQAIRLRPDFAPAFSQLGLTYLSQGRPTEAEAALRRSLELEPNDAETQSNYGSLLLQRGHAEQAIWHFKESLRLRSGYAKAHNNLGAALATLGRDREAIPHFLEAIRLAPDWSPPLNTLAWLRATHADAALRNGVEAVKLAERANTLTKHSDAGVLDTLAAAYAEVGDFDRAVDFAQRALDSADVTLAHAIRDRLELYRRKIPFREPPSSATAAQSAKSP